MIKLRDYQEAAVSDIIAALKKSKRRRVICEMPTGGGKTVVFSYIVTNASNKGSKTLILTDRTELLRETGNTLIGNGLFCEFIQAGRKYPPKKFSTFIAMAQTLKNRIKDKNWHRWFASIDLIIIDECHKQEFNNFFDSGLFDNKTVIGFSATPKRNGKQRQLGQDYDEIVHTLTTKELIEKGFLMSDMYYGFKSAPDMKGVARGIDGDYSENQMFKKFDTPVVYSGLIEQYNLHTPNTIALVFCTSQIHCVRTVKEFEKQGIKAKFLCSGIAKPKIPEGDEPEKKEASAKWIKYWEDLSYYTEYNDAMPLHSGERKNILSRWMQGDFKILVNAGILTTGFNYPAIETIALLRATTSEVLYLQMLGRGSRIFDGKTHFNILDLGGNAERIGSYRLKRIWSLYHDNKTGNGNAPIKECGVIQNASVVDKNGKKGCGQYIFASIKICPECGYVFPEKKEAKKIELEFLADDKNGKMKPVKSIASMTFEELEELARVNFYKSGWVVRQIAQRGGVDELKKYAKHKNYSHGWVTITENRLNLNVDKTTK